MCLGRIGHRAGLIASTMAGCGTLMRMIAVCGSGRVDLLDRAEHGLERVVGLDRHDREGDVGRGDRLAVVEDRVLAQVQRQRLAVFGELPGLGEVGLRVPLVVEAQRAGEELRRGHRGGDARLHRAVEVPRRLRAADHQRAAALGFLRRGRTAWCWRRRPSARGRGVAAGQAGRVHGISGSDRQRRPRSAAKPRQEPFR